jgi:hypothetical protein
MRWILVSAGEGYVDVLRGGRQVASHLNASEASRYLRSHKQPGDVVFREEPDGYRVRLSARQSGRRKR